MNPNSKKPGTNPPLSEDVNSVEIDRLKHELAIIVSRFDKACKKLSNVNIARYWDDVQLMGQIVDEYQKLIGQLWLLDKKSVDKNYGAMQPILELIYFTYPDHMPPWTVTFQKKESPTETVKPQKTAKPDTQETSIAVAEVLKTTATTQKNDALIDKFCSSLGMR